MLDNLAIVGNGIIGTLCAIEIKKKYPKIKIQIIGDKNRPFSASVGAGAMANVYAEIENGPFKDANEARFLNIGLKARHKWLKIFDQLKITKKVITAKDTIVFLKKNASSFENYNYNNMKEAALADKKAHLLAKNKVKQFFPNTYNKIQEATLLKDEFAICTVALFNHLDKIKKKYGIISVNSHVKKIKTLSNNKLRIDLQNENKSLVVNNIIVTAGSNSESIFDKKLKLIPMLQGVGSAIILNDINDLPNSFQNYVVRTVNRGGAQCGLHTVPRSNGTLYLGAGNYISRPGIRAHRLETIRYLYELFSDELVGKKIAYPLYGNLSLGYRPRTMDGFPCIGNHQIYQNIFFATGTNRVGLTWAPEIVNQALKWLDGKKISNDFEGWHPDRDMISYGNDKKCIDYFVNSRLSAGLEHNNFSENQTNKIKKELTNIANNQIKKIKKLYPGIIINPDNWQIILNNES